MINSTARVGLIIASALFASCTKVNIYPGASAQSAGNVPASLTSTSVPSAAMSMDTGKAAPPCAAITKEIVASGKKIFGGAGNCATCHGQNAKGTPLAPDLTDKTWLQIDGSYPAVVSLIHAGVPKPKSHPAPMPPMGGAALTDVQDCTVGAYVFSLTHPIL